MKKKELKKLAGQIADAELSLQAAKTPEDKNYYRNEIMRLSCRITSLEDVMALDELIQKNIEEKMNYNS